MLKFRRTQLLKHSNKSFSILGQEFGRFAGALSLKNCLLHICGEILENAHDAISDTLALQKIAEYGAADLGKKNQPKKLG